MKYSCKCYNEESKISLELKWPDLKSGYGSGIQFYTPECVNPVNSLEINGVLDNNTCKFYKKKIKN